MGRVQNDYMGRGIGRKLVEAIIMHAEDIELNKIFTLTLEPGFFLRNGFEEVEKGTLPMKVWSDCARCSKQDHCDEIAMARKV